MSRRRKTAEFRSGKVLPADLPMSESVRVGDLVFLSGQIGLQPGKMSLVPGGVREETRQALENVQTVLKACGCTLGDVVKCTVYLADIAEWPEFNDVYRLFFSGGPQPVRTAVSCDLAVGARVEIECVALAPQD